MERIQRAYSCHPTGGQKGREVEEGLPFAQVVKLQLGPGDYASVAGGREKAVYRTPGTAVAWAIQDGQLPSDLFVLTGSFEFMPHGLGRFAAVETAVLVATYQIDDLIKKAAEIFIGLSSAREESAGTYEKVDFHKPGADVLRQCFEIYTGRGPCQAWAWVGWASSAFRKAVDRAAHPLASED